MVSITLLGALAVALVAFTTAVMVYELQTPVALSVWLSVVVAMSGLIVAWMIRTWMEASVVHTTGGLGMAMFVFAGFYELLTGG